MKFDDLSIQRSRTTQGAYHLHAEFMGYKYDGWFDDLGGFLQAVADLATFVGVKLGKIKPKDSRFTSSRDIT